MAALTGPPCRIVAGGLTVRVRLTPKASQNRVEGPAELADGTAALRATVTAAPESGKANAALLRLLAKTWRLPRTALAVTGGATGRLKTVTICGDGAALAGMLHAWCAALATPENEGESRREGDRS